MMSTDAIATQRFPAAAMRSMADPARTLLLVIDIQVDFSAPDGAMAALGLDLASAEPAIDRIGAMIDAARAAGVAVGFARVVTRPETDAANLRALYERLGYGSDAVGICRDGTEGAAHYRLHPAPGDLDIRKTRYSCFVGTDLEATLRARGIDTIVAVGMSTDCCVDCTVRDGFHRDFHLLVAADACADYNTAAHVASLNAMGRHCAVLVESADLIDAWREPV